jgi:hypothetical protein
MVPTITPRPAWSDLTSAPRQVQFPGCRLVRQCVTWQPAEGRPARPCRPNRQPAPWHGIWMDAGTLTVGAMRGATPRSFERPSCWRARTRGCSASDTHLNRERRRDRVARAVGQLRNVSRRPYARTRWSLHRFHRKAEMERRQDQPVRQSHSCSACGRRVNTGPPAPVEN